MADFEKATRPEPTGEPGRYRVLLDEQWGIGPKLHGGYLLAIAARAAIETVTLERPEHVCPQAATGTFLQAPDPGPATLEVTVLRTGRGVSQARVALATDAGACLEVACVLAPQAAPSEHDRATAPVEMTPFAQCPRTPPEPEDGRGRLPLMEVVDTRLDPRTAGFARGEPSGEGRVSGWVALDTGEPWTPPALLLALDVLPPATFDLGVLGWSPTISLSAHVTAPAAPGPLRATQYVETVGADRMHETCLLWDTEDRLVGHAHQLAGIRRR